MSELGIIDNLENVASPSRALSGKHYPALDGLRGVAALLIVWHHFMQLVPVHEYWLAHIGRLSQGAWIGVDLFFVLSGFLITGILADSKFKRRYFRSFYGRRMLRIFPLYYAVLFLVLFVLPRLGFQTGVPPASHPFLLTYLSNFDFARTGWFPNYLSHVWTLAIEEQFYLIWPLIIFLAPTLERMRRVLLLFIVLIFVLRTVLYTVGVNPFLLYLGTLTHCDGLLLGSYLALAMRSGNRSTLSFFRSQKAVLIAAVALATAIIHQDDFPSGISTIPVLSVGTNVIILPLLAVLFAWLVYHVVSRTDGRLFRLFTNRVLCWYGKYSYALYILHVPIAFMVLVPNHSWLSTNPAAEELELLALYLGTCSLAAFLSWHLFEKHFLKLKRFFQPAERAALPDMALEEA